MSGKPRVSRNDEVIPEAAASVLADDGWAQLGLTSVARRAGVSVRPVRDRYPDRLALAQGAWERVIAPVWTQSMSAVLAAADAGAGLATALAPFARPDGLHRAAGELLLVSVYDEQVREVITGSAITPLAEALDPVLAGGAERAAVRGYVVMLALGLLLESWRSHALDVDLTSSLLRVEPILRSPGRPHSLPDERAPHLDAGAVVETGDPLWDAVLKATLRQVGTRGYEAATVEAIVAEAGCSQTVLFRRYPTKADAFHDASRRMIGVATELNVTYQQRMAAEHSPGLAEAIMLREFMRPGRDIERVLGLEQYRLVWHNQAMGAVIEGEQQDAVRGFLDSLVDVTPEEALARLHLEFAVGMGPVLLAGLVPQAWQLPFDVVTVPLIDGHE